MKRKVTLELDARNAKAQAASIRDLLQHGCAKSVCETEQEAYQTVIDALRVRGLID
jgi:hypothetical protein